MVPQKSPHGVFYRLTAWSPGFKGLEGSDVCALGALAFVLEAFSPLSREKTSAFFTWNTRGSWWYGAGSQG